MKACSRCKAEKPLTEFYVRKGRPRGGSDCKECAKPVAREWHRKNRERSRATAAAWKAQNPDRCDAAKHRSNMRSYGITPERYDEMMAMQGHSCGICGKHQDNEVKRLAVDHCHATGEVRALLCHNCNKALGLFRDSPDLLSMAAKYLEHFSE